MQPKQDARPTVCIISPLLLYYIAKIGFLYDTIVAALVGYIAWRFP